MDGEGRDREPAGPQRQRRTGAAGRFEREAAARSRAQPGGEIGLPAMVLRDRLASQADPRAREGPEVAWSATNARVRICPCRTSCLRSEEHTSELQSIIDNSYA